MTDYTLKIERLKREYHEMKERLDQLESNYKLSQKWVKGIEKQDKEIQYQIDKKMLQSHCKVLSASIKKMSEIDLLSENYGLVAKKEARKEDQEELRQLYAQLDILSKQNALADYFSDSRNPSTLLNFVLAGVLGAELVAGSTIIPVAILQIPVIYPIVGALSIGGGIGYIRGKKVRKKQLKQFQEYNEELGKDAMPMESTFLKDEELKDELENKIQEIAEKTVKTLCASDPIEMQIEEQQEQQKEPICTLSKENLYEAEVSKNYYKR